MIDEIEIALPNSRADFQIIGERFTSHIRSDRKLAIKIACRISFPVV